MHRYSPEPWQSANGRRRKRHAAAMRQVSPCCRKLCQRASESQQQSMKSWESGPRPSIPDMEVMGSYEPMFLGVCQVSRQRHQAGHNWTLEGKTAKTSNRPPGRQMRPSPAGSEDYINRHHSFPALSAIPSSDSSRLRSLPWRLMPVRSASAGHPHRCKPRQRVLTREQSSPRTARASGRQPCHAPYQRIPPRAWVCEKIPYRARRFWV
jgi:hypothetical protein